MSNNSAVFSDIVQGRRSVREYEDREVEKEVLDAIIEDVKWSPSWCNTHPYTLCIARGDKVVRLREAYCKLYDDAMDAARGGMFSQVGLWASGGAPDGDYNTIIKYPAHLQKHRVECAKGLYGLMGIERNDKKAREAQDRRNFEFFDCSTVIFVLVEGTMGVYSPLDAGFALDTLLLSAHAHGVATCAQGALATWSSPVKSEFKIPDGYKLLCGVSMGYEKKDAKINTFKPTREPVNVIY